MVKGDAVGVLRVEYNWVEADYVRGDRVIRGWFKQDDLFPDLPPK